MGMYWQFGTPRSACRKDLFTGLGVLVDTYPNEEKHLETGAEDEVHHTHTEDLPLCVGDGVCTAMLRNHNHNTSIFIKIRPLQAHDND
uniref:VIP36-like protein isoform X3 n=1 Tax=Oncorhynchus gorbuscha TaxID=8017 RepID=UPI001EAF462E|nr:VIP36-like protein isoform X3 [Oncorhynchus gorbuscha]